MDKQVNSAAPEATEVSSAEASTETAAPSSAAQATELTTNITPEASSAEASTEASSAAQATEVSTEATEPSSAEASTEATELTTSPELTEQISALKDFEADTLSPLPRAPYLEPHQIPELTPTEPPSLASIDAHFLEMLESALNKSENWKEQIYLCLQGVSRVLSALMGLKSYEEQSLSIFPQIQTQGQHIKAQVAYLNALVQNYNDYFDSFNRVLLANNATLAKRYVLVLEQVKHVRTLIAQASAQANDVLAFRIEVSALLEKLASLEGLKAQLVEMNTSAQAHIKQMQEIATESLTNIKQNCLSVINQLKILEGQISQNLLNTSQRVISEVELIKQSTERSIEKQLALVDQRIEQEGTLAQEKINKMDLYLSVVLKARDVAQALVKAFENTTEQAHTQIVELGQSQLSAFNAMVLAKLEEYNTNAQAKLADYNSNDAQKLQEYNDNALAKLEEHNTNAAQKLEDYNSNDAQKLQEFNDNYLAKLADLNNNLASSLVSARLEVENFNGANMAKLEEFEQRAQEAIAQYNSNALAKLEEHNTNAAQKLKDFNDTDAQKLQEFNDNALAKLEEYNANASQKLKDFNDNHDVKLANFNSTTEALTTQSTQSLTSLKETLLQAVLDGSMQERAQIAQLKELLERLQAKQSRFGADFQARIFTESSTFETPTQGLYYFIFVQGGTGADNSTQGGAPSSFGSLISAPGGAGGGNAAGQRGGCKSGWFKIEQESTTITIGNGGCCVISWAGRIS